MPLSRRKAHALRLILDPDKETVLGSERRNVPGDLGENEGTENTQRVIAQYCHATGLIIPFFRRVIVRQAIIAALALFPDLVLLDLRSRLGNDPVSPYGCCPMGAFRQRLPAPLLKEFTPASDLLPKLVLRSASQSSTSFDLCGLVLIAVSSLP